MRNVARKKSVPDDAFQAVSEQDREVRIIRLAEQEIKLVALREMSGWSAVVEAPSSFPELAFHGRLPKIALDQAEAFVRRVDFDVRTREP